MKLVIERDILAVALSRMTPLIGKTTIPILGCVKITASIRQIEISGQNLTASVTQAASAVVDEPGEFCVAADKFAALVNSLPKGSQIEAELVGSRLVVCYGKGRASFATDDPMSFPVMRAADQTSATFSLPTTELRRLFTMLLPLASDEETRPYLKGIYLVGDGHTLRAVATDGNGLGVGCADAEVEFGGIIVPAASVAGLIRILSTAEGDAEVAISTNCFAVTIGSCSFQTKLVDGTFPQYQRVIPARVDTPILIEAPVFEEIARRAQAVTEAADQSKAHPRSIRLRAEGATLRIEAGTEADQRIEETVEIIPIEGIQEIALGTAYVLDAVQALGSEGLLALHIAGSDKPMLMVRDRADDQELVVLMGRRF